MIDCPECKGAGQVATTYREATPKKPVAQKKEFCIIDASMVAASKAIHWLKEWWGLFPIGAIVCLFAWVMHAVWLHDNERAAIKAKQTYLIVQYNDANEVQRCYTSPDKDTVSVVGKGITVYIDNIEKPDNIPASVGVSDLSKCISYRYSK